MGDSEASREAAGGFIENRGFGDSGRVPLRWSPFSFARPGLVHFLRDTHGLHRGLHSYTAARLNSPRLNP